MPHVVVKLFPGRSAEQKERLAAAITRDLIEIAGSTEDAVSVAIVDVQPADWNDTVYATEIAPMLDTLHKKPGYTP
jgi:4-oxalocrotonate tautomerase